MENSIYLGITKQIAAQTNLDIIANNIANMNTSGYRGQNLLFDEYVEDPRGSDDELSFVLNRGQYENTAPGPVKNTNNPMDVYLDGPGFIGVIAPDGTPSYTRAGSFQMTEEGILTNAAGFPIATAGGGQIIIPQNSTEVRFDERGFVSNQDGQIAQMQIVEFENPQSLAAKGNGLYTTEEGGNPALNTRLKQGFLEGSNVKPVVEMTRMIDTLRSFQQVQNMLNNENDRLTRAIQSLTISN